MLRNFEKRPVLQASTAELTLISSAATCSRHMACRFSMARPQDPEALTREFQPHAKEPPSRRRKTHKNGPQAQSWDFGKPFALGTEAQAQGRGCIRGTKWVKSGNRSGKKQTPNKDPQTEHAAGARRPRAKELGTPTGASS